MRPREVSFASGNATATSPGLPRAIRAGRAAGEAARPVWSEGVLSGRRRKQPEARTTPRPRSRLHRAGPGLRQCKATASMITNASACWWGQNASEGAVSTEVCALSPLNFSLYGEHLIFPWSRHTDDEISGNQDLFLSNQAQDTH